MPSLNSFSDILPHLVHDKRIDDSFSLALTEKDLELTPVPPKSKPNPFAPQQVSAKPSNNAQVLAKMAINDKEFAVPPVPPKSKPNPLLVTLLTAKPIANPHLGTIETSKTSGKEGSEVNKS